MGIKPKNEPKVRGTDIAKEMDDVNTLLEVELDRVLSEDAYEFMNDHDMEEVKKEVA